MMSDTEQTFRRRCALLANQCADHSDGLRGRWFPVLTEDSNRDTLTVWLQTNDPNGCYTDDLAEGDGFDPLTLDGAWTALSDIVADATGQHPGVDADWCPEPDAQVQARNDAMVERQCRGGAK